MIKDMNAMGLKLKNGQLSILDQSVLPDSVKWLDVHTPEQMAIIIKTMKVRGAPLIGVAAGLSLALFALKTHLDDGAIQEAALLLNNARPTAVNLKYAIEVVTQAVASGSKEQVAQAAIRLFDEDVKTCERLAQYGASLMADGDGVLTHCNAGALATVGVGTALGVLTAGFNNHKSIRLFLDETRPLLQGARLSSWELSQQAIPHTLICDNMAAKLIASGQIQKIFVGADRIALNGDTANKVGTYGLAIVAQHHGVPFYIVAPRSTIDRHCRNGNDIPIEMRPNDELDLYSVVKRQSDPYVRAWNPSFDVTPVELITGIILETGIYTQETMHSDTLEVALCGA